MSLVGCNPVCTKLSKYVFRLISFYDFKFNWNGAQTVRNINEVWGNGYVSECTVELNGDLQNFGRKISALMTRKVVEDLRTFKKSLNQQTNCR